MAKRHVVRFRPRRSRLPAALLVLAGMGVIAFLGMTTPSGLALTVSADDVAAPRPKDSPTPSPTPCGRFTEEPFFPSCVSPSPSVIVITPVPEDSPSPSVKPAYLIGLSPSPSQGADVGGAIAPLGGAADDPLNRPGGGGGSQRTETVRTDTPPLPLLFLGLVLASGAAGYLLYRYGPRARPLPRSQKPGAVVIPSEYGGEGRAVTTLLDPEVRPAPAERRRRRGGAPGT